MKVFLTRATCEIPAVAATIARGESLEKRIIFCEDKFTLALELALAKTGGGTFGTQVFSFNRFMKKYLKGDKKPVSTEGSALIVKGILLQKKDELLCFKNVNEPNLASAVYELIAQLKSAKVTVCDVERAAAESEGNLKRKLSDIAVIFGEYEKKLNDGGMTDGNNRLYALPELIGNLDFLKNAEVIVAGFSSLNRTLCEIFFAFDKNVKNLKFVISYGENTGVYTNEIYNFLNNNFNCEFTFCESLPLRKRLLDGLYSPKAKEGDYEKNVHFYRADSKYAEIENVARIIRSRVLSGEKYKSFALAAEDVSQYSLCVRRVFSDYEIPFFIDETKDLGKHPLTLLVCSVIDLARRRNSPEDFLATVKNPAFMPDFAFADRLENYVVKNAYSRKAIGQPFIFPDDEKDEFEKIRGAISRLTALFKENEYLSKSIEAINSVLELTGAEQNLIQLGEDLSKAGRNDLFDYNAQAAERFRQVLSEAEKLLGDKKMSLAEVKNVILSGMTACKISLIPEFNDSVFIGDFRAVRYKQYKKVFAIGLNEDVPLCKTDCALLNDKDLNKLDGVNVLVEPKIKDVNRRAREAACLALASFSEELFLSYNSAGGSEYSEIIEYALKIFGCKKQNLMLDESSYRSAARRSSGEAAEKYAALGYMTKRTAYFSFARDASDFKENKTDDFSAASAYYDLCENKPEREILNGVLGSANSEMGYYVSGVDYAGKSLSTTAIEGFFSCPYANFLNRGLKLKERELNDAAASDLGSLVHAVAEKFCLTLNDIRDEEEAAKRAKNIFDEISALPEYARYGNHSSGKRALFYVRREVMRFCKDVYCGCKNSEFKPKFIETSFGYGAFPPIKLKTRRGEVRVTGKADRVDVFGEKMRIIDYKTGYVSPETLDENLYSGTKLQLFLYAKAFADKYGFSAAGAYYFPVADEFSQDGKDSVMCMQGRTLADEQTVYELDHGSRDGGERYVAAKVEYGKDGNIKMTKSLLTQTDFIDYLKYSELIAAEGLSEIKEGVIIPTPHNKACEYCKYGGICGYDEQTDGRMRSPSAGREDIVAAVAEECDESEDSSDGESVKKEEENNRDEGAR